MPTAELPVRIASSTAIAVSTLFPLTGQGVGSSISGLRFGGFLLSGTAGAVIPRAWGFAPLAIPALALIILASSLWDDRRAQWARLSLYGFVLVLGVGTLAAIGSSNFDGLGLGSWLAVGGALVGLSAAALTSNWSAR